MAKKKKQQKSKKQSKRARRGNPFLRAFKWLFVLGVWACLGLGALALWYARDLPDIMASATFERDLAVTVKDAEGNTLTRYGQLKGAAVSFEDIPTEMIYAILAIEDRRFYEHFGVDPLGIARAAFVNLTEGDVVQGGSTITQQLAKNLFLTHERTIRRKIQEALLAIWLEQKLTKDEILTAYLNRVYFGSGAYGIEAAAQTYFNTSAEKLNLHEAALLAGLLKAPSRLSPLNNPEKAEARAEVVLAAMQDAGYLTEKHSAKISYASLPGRTQRAGGDARYFTDYALENLKDLIGSPDDDLVIETTLVPEIQSAAEKALADALDTHGEERNISQGAVLVMHKSGAILAMTGGRDYARSQFNRATQAYRPPGSAFKPVVYLAALEQGWRATDLVLDAPVTSGGYRPKNFGSDYHGKVILLHALSQSLNTASVRLAETIGIGNVLKTARKLGIDADLNRDLSLALGSSGVPMIEMAAVYNAFRNEGLRVDPYAVTRIESRDGELIYERTRANRGKNVIAESHVRDLNRMLVAVIETGTGKNAALNSISAAGKTGTSQDYRDAWFIGFAGDYTAAVWLGNDDNAPMDNVTGGSLPALIWKQTMRAALNAGIPDALDNDPEQDASFRSLLSSLLDGNVDARPARQDYNP